MQKESENKALTPKSPAVENKQRFFYPDHQITVEAGSAEEAEIEKEKIISKKITQ